MPERPKPPLRCDTCKTLAVGDLAIVAKLGAREIARVRRVMQRAFLRLKRCTHALDGACCRACVRAADKLWRGYYRTPDNFRGDSQTRLRAKSRVTKNGCIEWTGACTNKGYGRTYHLGNRIAVHRLAWELKRGPIPDGLEVCHRCDNRPCFNVEHLFLGTRRDNVLDMFTKGRNPIQTRRQV